MTTLDELSEHKNKLELHRKFPISIVSIIRRSFKWLFLYSLILILYVVGHYKINEDRSYIASYFENELLSRALVIATVYIVIKLIYEFIYYLKHFYAIEDGHLIISEGVFLRQRAAFPITAISDVYLDRKILDFVLGLYNLHVSNPSAKSHSFGDIKGLSAKSGVGLQDYMRLLTQETSPENEKANEIEPEDLNI